VSFVFDASVVLAVVFEESPDVIDLSDLLGGRLSNVNYCEVLTRCLERGMDVDFAERQIARLKIETLPFTAADARAAAELRAVTRHRGLSLGDRACLALARREGLPVLTADRQWEGLDVGVDIRLIR
jgi:PIN domain nuclease of toxin-antitoxin system